MIWVDFTKDHQSGSAGDWLCMVCEKLCVFCGAAERESASTKALGISSLGSRQPDGRAHDFGSTAMKRPRRKKIVFVPSAR
jgi:hypothetical protein